MTETRRRIFELDALRGLCILGMVIVHLVLDWHMFIGGFTFSPVFVFVRSWGGVLFILISGICVTLGHHPIKRGAVVLGCGLLVSAVTWGMEFFGFAADVMIWFGILHCLGVCMLVAPVFARLPKWALPVLGLCMIAAGFWVHTLTVEPAYLFPLGLMRADFASADYFPLLPNLGWFLLGMFAGKTLYAPRKTLLPKVNENVFPLPFLCWCGRQSLWIYLLHQPVLFGLFYLLA